jgi:hypothetical protein
MMELQKVKTLVLKQVKTSALKHERMMEGQQVLKQVKTSALKHERMMEGQQVLKQVKTLALKRMKKSIQNMD